MSNLHIDSVLAQIRSLSAQVHAPAHTTVGAPKNIVAGQAGPDSVGKAVNGSGDFAALMRDGIEQVNRTQLRATDLATAFERGAPGVELPDVMLEMQKANVSFRALAEVRNRFVNVYQEIMSMPI